MKCDCQTNTPIVRHRRALRPSLSLKSAPRLIYLQRQTHLHTRRCSVCDAPDPAPDISHLANPKYLEDIGIQENDSRNDIPRFATPPEKERVQRCEPNGTGDSRLRSEFFTSASRAVPESIRPVTSSLLAGSVFKSPVLRRRNFTGQICFSQRVIH